MLDDYEWHFDYTRLVRDTGFKFQINRPKSSLVNNIAHIDIQNVVLHQDIQLIDKSIGTILQFSLDNEQTSVLDPNFVKIFHISQLAVQYLLFCKIYLDNTVAHLKKEDVKNKEQINQLNCYIEELKSDSVNSKTEIKQLQAALNCQVASTQNIAVFQCNQCPKAFSTEEYLLAHIQRRHESFGHGTSFQVETDKLQSEIKALKERLNNTEKYIHSDDEKSKHRIIDNMSIKNNNVENTLLTDLQHKFELLKMHVDNELRILQTQKFDQEKYEQWFGTFLNKLDYYNNDKNLKPLGEGDVKSNVKEVNCCTTCQKKDKNTQSFPIVELQIERNDHATQTDFAESINQKVCKNCGTSDSALADQESAAVHSKINHDGYLSDKELQPHFDKLEEMLQERVTGSIEKLETQMQSFCDKMSELEKQNLTAMIKSSKPVGSPINVGDASENEIKVVPKARKKWNAGGPIGVLPHTRTLNENPITPKSTETTDITVPILSTTPNQILTNSINIMEESETADSISCVSDKDKASENVRSSRKSDTTSDSTDTYNKFKVVPIKRKPSGTSTVAQRSLKSLKRRASTGEAQNNRKNEIEYLLNKQLIELGISPDWSTIPIDSYQRAIQIVAHQGSLIKKKFPNYKKIMDQILRDVGLSILDLKKHGRHTQDSYKAVIKGNCVNSSLGKDSDQQIEAADANNKLKPIKKMYDSASDTDSDQTLTNRKALVWGKNIPDQTQKKYYNVIQELNAKTKNNLSSEICIEAVPSPKNVVNDEAKTELAKGVLKNYPSVTSLHKKKVLFNLKSSEVSTQKEKVIPVKAHSDDSTSSIGSSVFDGSKTNLVECVNKKKVWNVSDSDLNEILK